MFLGNRYRNSPNMIWNLGNDFQALESSRNMTTLRWRLRMESGVRTANILTVEFIFPASQSQDDPNWVPRINMNSVYSYLPSL